MTDNDNIIVRPAKKEDIIPSFLLMKELGLPVPDKEDIEHHRRRMWEDNPYYDSFKEDKFYGWVMECKGEVVGYFGCIPRVYSFNNEKIPVAVGHFVGVRKNYRKFTRLLCESFFNKTPIPLKLFTTANEASGKMFERYGGTKIPVPALQTVYMIPLNFSKLIDFRFSSDSLKNSAIKYILKRFDFFNLWKYKHKYLKKDYNLKQVDINSLPDDFDVFMENYTRQKAGLLAVRDSSLLKWFYADNCQKSQKIHFVYFEDNKTAGYASIMNLPVEDGKDLSRYIVVDFISKSLSVKKSMLNALIQYGYETAIDVLEIHLPGMIDRREIPGIVLSRKLAHFPAYYYSTDSELSEELLIPANWYITPFDGDRTV